MTMQKQVGMPIYVRESRPVTPWADQAGIPPEARSYDRDELWFTQHALSMLRAREITPEAVYAVMALPDVIEPNMGRLRFVRNGLVVVLGSRKHRYNNWPIITVLLRESKQWTNEDVRER